MVIEIRTAGSMSCVLPGNGGHVSIRRTRGSSGPIFSTGMLSTARSRNGQNKGKGVPPAPPLPCDMELEKDRI